MMRVKKLKHFRHHSSAMKKDKSVIKYDDSETSNVEGTERRQQFYCFPWVDERREADILKRAVQELSIKNCSAVGTSVKPGGTSILTNHRLFTAEMSNETHRKLPILLNLEGSKIQYEKIGHANGWVGGKKFKKSYDTYREPCHSSTKP